MLNFQKFKSILCLHGDLPEQAFFKQFNLPIFAADGAANLLVQMGIIPQLVIGDLDGITAENKNNLKTFYHYDQNYCDYEKCLQFLKKEKLLPSLILGLNGGYLDHILNNINIFLTEDCGLYAPPIYGFMLRNQKEKLVLPIHTKISLLGIPFARVSTKGLQWELSNDRLAFPGRNACFNRTVLPEILLQVMEGQIIVLMYDNIRS